MESKQKVRVHKKKHSEKAKTEPTCTKRGRKSSHIEHPHANAMKHAAVTTEHIGNKSRKRRHHGEKEQTRKRTKTCMSDSTKQQSVRDHQMPHITQIAARKLQSTSTFSSYVKPEIPISPEAQRLTGITMAGNTMFVHGKPVKARKIKSAMRKFLKWLESFSDVILVAHYGRKFDFPVFMTACLNIDQEDQLSTVVSGLADSWEILKDVRPGLNSYKLPDLVKKFVHSTYGAHDAVEDVNALAAVITETQLSSKRIHAKSFPVESILNYVKEQGYV